MEIPKEELESVMLGLSAHDRAHLAHLLIESLDVPEERDVEAAWLEEAELRHEQYRKGLVATRDAAVVFREAKRRFE